MHSQVTFLSCSPHVLLTLLALVSIGCSNRPAQVSIAHIVIDVPREFDTKVAERETIRALVREHIDSRDTASRWVTKREDESHTLYLSMGYAVDPSAINPPTPLLLLRVRLRGKDGPEYQATATIDPEPWTASVERGFEAAWETIWQQRKIEAASDRDVLASLKDTNPALAGFAIERLGERRTKQAVAPLIEILQRTDAPELSLKAVGSLIRIGDETAVPALIELSSQRDQAFMLQMIFAVAAIGGRTAEGFLVTVASGHPVPEIQAGARDALDDLKRRQSLDKSDRR